MSQTVTTEVLHKALNDQTDEIIGLLRDFMVQADERFNSIEKEITNLKESHDRLINTIDGFISRIDKYETELTARDSQFEKLLV